MSRDPRPRRTTDSAPARPERSGGSTPPGPLPAGRSTPSGSGGDGQPADPAELLRSGSPREVLARLVDGDPLALERRSRTHLAEQALLLDGERLFLRAVARAAFAAPRLDGEVDLEAWLAGQVERAARDLVDEDRAAERAGASPPPEEERGAFLAGALGLEPAVARRACVVFNDLPPRVRRVWWAAVVERCSLERCVARGLGTPAAVRADLRRALLALSLLEDPGPGPEEGGDGRDA